MNRKIRNLGLLTVILLLFTGCQALTGKTLGRNIDDATITTWVKSKLVGERAANLTRVNVKTNNGVVYLTGTVDSTEWREKAEQVTREVDGVQGVVNNIQIQR